MKKEKYIGLAIHYSNEEGYVIDLLTSYFYDCIFHMNSPSNLTFLQMRPVRGNIESLGLPLKSNSYEIWGQCWAPSMKGRNILLYFEHRGSSSCPKA